MPGKAKTRLIPLLGPRGAAEFQAALTADVLRKTHPLENRLTLVLMTAGSRRLREEYAVCAVSDDRLPVRVERQRGQHLGERLHHAFRKLLSKHTLAVVIGTDSPELSVRTLLRAFRELRGADAVLGPCPDGGYYLVGMRRRSGRLSPPHEQLFQGVRWGTPHAFRDTFNRFARHGLSCALLDPLEDIDRPEDLERLKERMVATPALRRRAPATWKFLRRGPWEQRRTAKTPGTTEATRSGDG